MLPPLTQVIVTAHLVPCPHPGAALPEVWMATTARGALPYMPPSASYFQKQVLLSKDLIFFFNMRG